MELATLGQRLRGALVDAGLGIIPYIMVKADSDALKLTGIALFLVLVVAQCWLLARDGQTIGKRVAKTRIVRLATDENGGFVTNVVMRALVASLPNLIPAYWLVDVCFVFRQDRRCLHDWIAGTKVVNIAA